MIVIRHAQDRGQADHGWLYSQHTFSFANYHDPNHMGFSALRVINDDVVQPEMGFATHSHRNMEIISFVLEGTIAHKDSTGNIKTLPAGEFQLMSAGRGINHSEYNASSNESLHFLQIWITPNRVNTEPSYQQKNFEKKVGFTKIASPNGEDGSFVIKQDASLYQLILQPNTSEILDIPKGDKVYVHQVASELLLDDSLLTPGDGAKVSEQNTLSFKNNSNKPVTALVFLLP